ncbi:XRE family transcriptional regulator [Nitrosococcus wardiae]|uniref:XRE family transcriptional regulator n=1 Tax=Nitrosococcus wardiae TaxID=1814290 RepID=A0A4P7C5Q8_9GAMM|nr:XRE family transcriptional regulator [Nitrosococcus wardiae]QBQ56202.1 XRE family transcriptional regulator [Nitrosococcus wardiae]
MTGDRAGFITEADLLRRIAMTRQNVISERTGLSDSQVNRIVSSQSGLTLGKVVPFLCAIGYEVIEREGDMVSVPREEYEAMRTLARKALG